MIQGIPIEELFISPDRQRKDFDEQYIVDLSHSIQTNGLIHPVVYRLGEGGRKTLIAGECRSRAIKLIHEFGESVRCGTQTFGPGIIPAISVGDLDPIDAYEIELEENIRRKDLSWQERAEATEKLAAHRAAQAARKGEPPPTVRELSVEIRGSGDGVHQDQTRKELIVAKHIKTNPEVAKAKSVDEAFKVLKRQETAKRNEELGKEVGKTYGNHVHSVVNKDCVDQMRCMVEDNLQFDVILTDPPYGINAQDFNDSDGKAGGGHFYDDSYEYWAALMKECVKLWFNLSKPQAHAYIFCDIDNFVILKQLMKETGWNVFRTPLVWINPDSQRAPWPQQGPQRKYQLCLFAVKGSRNTQILASDVITYRSDDNLGHQAQKPVALYQDLLKRSCRPGDRVLDSFCGTGTIFRAAHELKLIACGIEKDAAAYGIAVKRIQELK